MKKFIFIGLAIFGTGILKTAHAQWSRIDTSGFLVKDSIYRSGYTLIFINKDSTFSPAVKARLIRTFFIVYPEEAKRFNPGTAKKVIFVIDPAYDGIAATGNTLVRFNPAWFRKHPQDIDVVTHEAMHIVQHYRHRNVPGWLTEGIADYVRYTYGVNNKASGWTLPGYKKGQSYKDAYRVTARFLLWVQKNYNRGIVDKLNSAGRHGTYRAEWWKMLTGKSVGELWELYGKDPELKLQYQ